MKINEHIRKSDLVNARRHNILLDILGYSSIGAVTLSMLVIGFWWFYPYKVITYDHTPFHIVQRDKKAETGTALSYEYNYTKYMNIAPTVTKQFVDGIVFESASAITVKPIGSGHVISEIPIPQTLPPGKYHLKITASYKVNPIRTITIINETESFTVISSIHEDELMDKTLGQEK
jgi:hypothetical protein